MSRNDDLKLKVPAGSPMRAPGFIFGVATSAFQIEGASDARLPCIWDSFCATPGKIRDHSNGRVACDHLARWHSDLELITSLGLDAYRFSISWPRVMHADGTINRKGVGFYLQLLDSLNERHCKPFVTLYHWDLPQYLQEQGGWPNRDTAFRFRDYVDQITRALGDRVYSYVTLNEPWCSAYLGYETGVHAPGLTDKTLSKKAAHHLLLAHGLGMQVLEQNSPATLNGIVVNLSPSYGATDSAADRAAAVAADTAMNQWYLKPLLQGVYPESLERLPVAERPDIQADDLNLISQPLDFLGVNYYTRAVYKADAAAGFVQVPPAPPLTEMGWEIYPQGLTDMLVSLHEQFDLPPVYVAENGAATADVIVDGMVNDATRIRYFQQHLDALDRALERGVRVAGYFHWSLLDNFEWAEGYAKRFGLVYVDYATQRRTMKQSAHAYAELLRERAAANGGTPAGS